MESIFIVTFSCGTYDDYRTGVVCATQDLDKAERLVDRLTALAKYKNEIGEKVMKFFDRWGEERPWPILDGKTLDDAEKFAKFREKQTQWIDDRNAAVAEYEKQEVAKHPMPEEFKEMLKLDGIDNSIDWRNVKFTYSSIMVW